VGVQLGQFLVWVIVCGQTVVIASGRPVSPSQTTMSTSAAPRFSAQ
jgi:hypothetical protein